MIAQVTTECKSPVTHAAGMRLLALMTAHVGITDYPLVEPLSTKLADMAAAAILRMLRRFMHPGSRPLGKPLSANATREIPSPSMDVQVLIQRRRTLEPLGTLVTGMWTLVCMAHDVEFKPVR